MEITPTCIHGNGPPHFVNGWGMQHANIQEMLSKYWPETLTDKYVFGDETCWWMCIQTFSRRRVVNIKKMTNNKGVWCELLSSGSA
jgi:hypothetical protein